MEKYCILNIMTMLIIYLMNNLEENAFKNEHPDEYFAYLITDKIIGTFDENDQKIIDYITY